ncbi:cobaltochelatase CobN subunit [Methanococcoides vulcani]|uniref:Cobaltochelatase CobN subunit n=1 Tax=Methanococcoides vulcani TaxID=1353158 RepID=A0A1H9YJX6_9EURY|nr:cobaltochelatase subunit CobN [Methanococcoides vulcani]SES68896.1 cobaltochelatase CobN subunit [Methanococcoides vulcani]
MKIASIMWNSYIPVLARASEKLGFELAAYATGVLEDDPQKMEEAVKACDEADVILLYHTDNFFWEELEEKLESIKDRVPVVCLGHDPAYWKLSTVGPEIVANCYSYITFNGEENLTNLLLYLGKEALGLELEAGPPKKVLWDGLYHPDASYQFPNVDKYLQWYKPDSRRTVGILFSRTSWVNNALDIENTLIKELESRGLGVIPVFTYSVKDDELGARGMDEVINEYFVKDGKPLIDALVKLSPFFITSSINKTHDEANARNGIGLLTELDVPVFQPIISYHTTTEQWEESNGLSSDIGWSVAMPEFEGVIEPIIIGAGRVQDNYIERIPIVERCSKLASRVEKWVQLRNKPISERRVAFILHNNPCASVEATVGGAAHLDSIESTARILNRMQDEGYQINPPVDGKELIDTIMKKKAISEFRWTTVGEIVKNGGYLDLVDKEQYEVFFNTLSPKVKDRMIDAWGNPPGEAKDGVPAAMVHECKIVVTGVGFGNAVVCVQPKRGCAGTRCDGEVCKILHDPDLPPTHQYLATYRYLENTFGADVLVHVGTHGNMEFLPGKGVGLSGECYPDIAIGSIPHLYIYNADNPPEGAIAKRRGLATLVDHMQTVMTGSGLYDELEELDRLLGEYEQAKHDPGRAHALEHLIYDEIDKSNLRSEIRLEDNMPFGDVVTRTHEALGKIRNTQIQSGMHIFGQLPKGERRVEFINSILRYDDADGGASLRRIMAGLMELDFDKLIIDKGAVLPDGRSTGQILEEIDALCKDFIRKCLEDNTTDVSAIVGEILGDRLLGTETGLAAISERIADLNLRIEDSKEIESLLHGFDGGYIPAGPSGLITRGRDDILPTGRNFYSLDPYKVPTKAAWRVGKKLSQAVVDKYVNEESKLPENLAFYWMASDIMWADGEGMAQIMSLLGVEPVWQGNGRVKSFKIIPQDKLGRPRIDVTLRVSGILRDNFPNCIELIDEAIQAVASLDEPLDMNYVRKHSLEMAKEGTSWRDATLRIFSSKPGTYSAGVQLAVYASAWKDEKDLAEIFLYWNGYAYGKDVNGTEAHQHLANNLKTVDATFNKVVTDEYDLCGCCCYFGAHGGMTAAARHLSGKEVKTYYGDTREPGHVEVRDLADEIRRVVRTKLLNPKWIEGMKEHGYKGAGDISKRIGRVYGWEASTQEVDDWIFDDITKTFVLDDETRQFFEENNPYALEEIGRRLLEAESRGLWDADPDVLDGLKNAYLEIEGWMEDLAGEGEFQGGAVDIMTTEDVPDWNEKMQEIRMKIKAD